MKSINILTLLLFVCIHFCSAQNTTLVLKPTMLDQDSMQIFISDMKGWLFKQGNDTAWVRKEIDVSGWKRLMPAELSEKMVDKDGRVEGWFRIKIKPDSTFGETSFGFKISTWAASDLYIDGKWIASLGNTGLNGAPYRENRFAADLIPISVNLKPGNEYTVALHVVDYLSPLPPYNLKAKESELRSMIRVVVPKYYSTIVPEATNRIYFSIILVAISAVLSLLFWLLFFQNRSEKNLFLFSLASSILTISLIAQAVTINSGASYGGISFVWLWVFNQLEAVSFLMYFMSVPFILARIFKRRIPRIISFFFMLFILFTLLVTTGNLPSIEVVKKIVQIVSLTSFLFIFSVSIYYIVSSWKTLKGAQWAIVMGLLVPLFLLVIIILATFISKSFVENNINIYYFIFVLFLSFPFSLMIYVVMRFKEINHDVEENAKQVVQMSEEKKEQALNQQRILEEEVTRQTAEIRTALDNLKSTQSQLIQSEKMASLGELTAGIAHEIQNPLNFVNNFSEVSNELIVEMTEELDKGDIEEAKAISSDIKQNLEKINHHGKRASDIVKGMLEHSRKSTGENESTDINSLCDEYLRLAYHGLKAKDKNFNATMETHFDPNLPKIDIIPQDIGRVLLNLINNAFYAVNERANLLNLAKQSGDANLTDLDYKPTVSITTQLTADNQLEIAVKDNGSGIPERIKDKIFQPFFTTKPTGQGTGLGLSLSYDIIKAHGGQIKINTTENEGTTFILELPL